MAAGIADAAADLDSVLAMVTLQRWTRVVIDGGDGTCCFMSAAEPVQVAALQSGEDSKWQTSLWQRAVYGDD